MSVRSTSDAYLTTITIILAMSFGLIVPKLALDGLSERTMRPKS
jgi:hypothetical protein